MIPPSSGPLPILDTFDRVHNNLRISVTDRCNIRCFYCMPEFVEFLPQKDILSFEEITRFVRIVAQAGVKRIRLTGGEPLVRKQLSELIRMLRSIDGIEDIALTTNGILLAKQAQELREAGLDRLNVSLDTINADKFEKITRRKGLDAVLEGIAAAQAVGFDDIRINAVALAEITETEAIPLAHYCRDHRLELRFIEFMPLDADENWSKPQVLAGVRLRQLIQENIGAIRPVPPKYRGQPATDFEYIDGQGRLGFIDPVSAPFCSSCNRMRITAEGKLRNCLFSVKEWDMRSLLRDTETEDSTILEAVRECIHAKKAGHGIDSTDFQRPQKAMFQIGG